MDSTALVSVSLVTYNNESYLCKCLDALLAQSWPKLEVIVVDNASRDATREILSRYRAQCELIWNAENRGFCGAQNQAIRRARGDWVLALNPDVLLQPDFISSLLAAGESQPDVGTLCGKLLRANPDLSVPSRREVDSAGIYFTPTLRHFDRGHHCPDGSAYSEPAFVFGATGAAALYRRSMIQDVSVSGELFDEDFFFSREDADLAWRAQLMGWKCLYVPAAVGYHVRRVSPEVRRKLSAQINYHAVKNRFLMRIKNATPGLFVHSLLPAGARDAGILGYCLLRERSSLPAFSFVLRNWSRAWAKRRMIQQRRRVSDRYIRQWFRFTPVTLPATGPPSQASPAATAQPTRPVPAGSEPGGMR